MGGDFHHAELVKKILEVASKNHPSQDPDYSPYESSGGNCDDAFRGGYGAGEIGFANELKKIIESE